ncbi:NACHT domain-containing protein [Streptomyces chartreusis]|uniref:NACHT domain-containing protein n=1 Tax=Streptomyces chartreusis TaxID=1969 RepID=UPI00367430DF
MLADTDTDRMVLLGDPGAGKSSLTRHLALTLTRETLADDPLVSLAGRVPLVVELREYAAADWRERTFEDFLEHLHTAKGMAPPSDVANWLLRRGKAVVLFDGLDELFDPSNREQAAHRIADFAGRYRQAGVRTVVTSRAGGYKRGVLESAGFAHFMIQDPGLRADRALTRRWYATVHPHDEERALFASLAPTEVFVGGIPVRA